MKKKIKEFIYGLLVILFVITIHEAGHAIVGHLVGYKIKEVAIGFGPEILSLSKHEIIFSFRLILLGGFCEIDNLIPQDLNQTLTIKESLSNLAVSLAGVFINILMAFLILFSSKKNGISIFLYLVNLHLRSVKIINKKTNNKESIKNTEKEKEEEVKFIGPLSMFNYIGKEVINGNILYTIASVSITIGLINLIPISFLDGGLAITYILATIISFSKATFIMLIITIAIIFIVILKSSTKHKN